MKIETTLIEKQIEELFTEHSVFVRTLEKGEIHVVPAYKICDLFGLELGEWTESQIGINPEGRIGLLSGKVMWMRNPYTGHMILLVTQDAFRIIAAEYNARKLCSIMEISEASRQWDAIWDARCARLIDADKPHKSKGRKVKHEAASQEKQEVVAEALQKGAENEQRTKRGPVS